MRVSPRWLLGAVVLSLLITIPGYLIKLNYGWGTPQFSFLPYVICGSYFIIDGFKAIWERENIPLYHLSRIFRIGLGMIILMIHFNWEFLQLPL